MLTCASVEASSAWYQAVLGLASAHGGDEYEMLTHDGTLVLQLHETDHTEHPHLAASDRPLDGNGIALWFETDDFAGAIERMRSSSTTIEILTDGDQ